MTTSTFQCQIGTTDPACPLRLEIWLDQEQIYANDHVEATEIFDYEIEDDEREHELRFVLANKLPEHTEVDSTGAIVRDACLTVKNISFDGIELNHLFGEHTVYHHDFNGSGLWQQDRFYDTLGCNGTASFKFTMPIYLWLLEHM